MNRSGFDITKLSSHLFWDVDAGMLKVEDDLSVSDALKEFNSVTIIQKSENITIYAIEGIKVDIVNYKYPWLNTVMVQSSSF